MTNLIETMPRDSFVIYFFHLLVIQTQANFGSSTELFAGLFLVGESLLFVCLLVFIFSVALHNTQL